jgi:hypothetical protein
MTFIEKSLQSLKTRLDEDGNMVIIAEQVIFTL